MTVRKHNPPGYRARRERRAVALLVRDKRDGRKGQPRGYADVVARIVDRGEREEGLRAIYEWQGRASMVLP